MKGFLKFIRSMKFGMILMVLIMAISLVGTVITQGKAEDFYLTNYSMGQMILTLGLDNVYYTPYFLGLGALLILNLTLCSLVRFKKVLHAGSRQLEASLKMNVGTQVGEKEAAVLRNYLEEKKYRWKRDGHTTVYYRNQIGHIGSFLVHLSLVLLLLVGALVLYTGTSEFMGINYDAPVVLEDGTQVYLLDFVTQNEAGEVHYESTLEIVTPEGETYTGATSVNYPINYDGKKYFQETYSYSTAIRIWNTVTEKGDQMYLTEPSFLQTSDSGYGIHYQGMYTDYIEEEDGQISILSNQIQDGKPGVFLVTVYDETNEEGTIGVVGQGTILEVEGVQFAFDGISPYPGIRIKETNRGLMACLYATFGLMVVGLWFCFFQQPVYTTVGKNEDGWFYRISGLRDTEGMENELQIAMQEK